MSKYPMTEPIAQREYLFREADRLTPIVVRIGKPAPFPDGPRDWYCPYTIEGPDALREHFRPEFLNRIDEIVFFHPLDREHLKRIIDIQIGGLTKRLADRKIHVRLTEAAKEQLVREGYDPIYGARPLKRTIQRRVLDPLALRVLEGDFGEGDTIGVDAAKDGLVFEKQETVKA